MANGTSKPISNNSGENVLRNAANDFDGTIAVDGYLSAIVGRKIVQAISTTTVAGDTATLTFSENGITLKVYRVIYTDGTQAVLLSAERIA